MVRRTLKIFVISRATYSWTLLTQVRRTRNALSEPWQAIRTTRGQNGNGHNKKNFEWRTSPANYQQHSQQHKKPLENLHFLSFLLTQELEIIWLTLALSVSWRIKKIQIIKMKEREKKMYMKSEFHHSILGRINSDQELLQLPGKKKKLILNEKVICLSECNALWQQIDKFNHIKKHTKLLINDAIGLKDFIHKKIVKSPQNASNNSEEYNCQEVYTAVSGFCRIDIKHNQTSFPKQSTCTTLANSYESSQHYCYYSCCKKGSPQKSTSPPTEDKTDDYLKLLTHLILLVNINTAVLSDIISLSASSMRDQLICHN